MYIRYVNVGLGSFEDRYARTPVALAAAGGLVIALIGVLLPPTMFWSEIEITTLAGESLPLPHIFPQGAV
jgi:hypothetical protein